MEVFFVNALNDIHKGDPIVTIIGYSVAVILNMTGPGPQGGAGPVHEGLLTSLVLLAQHDVELLAPALVKFAETADMFTPTYQPLCCG